MKPVDHDIFGGPIYSPLDLAIQRAPIPVFDIARMKRALEGLSVEMPDGLSREELRAFIISHAEDR